MVRTILVDDERSGLNTLRKLLQLYCPELKIVAECEEADSAKEKIELLDPQLVFLDISLPGKSSFDLLSELGKINFEIIFVTAHHEFALQAFRYSAVDYLVKPVDEDILIESVKKAVKRIHTAAANDNILTLIHNVQNKEVKREMKLCIPSLNGFRVVEMKDILYCEASGSYTNFILTENNSICSAKPIYEYDELLSGAGFIRIHKSYLVNLLHVKEYVRGEGGSVILSDNREVAVSRRKKDYFLSRMKEFYKF
ncbi:MAG: LytR/AlgR family response regulator transcription factor [Ginsengibacter sp.]